LKNTLLPLAEEGMWRAITPYTDPYLYLKKTSDDGQKAIYVCVNKRSAEETVIDEWMVPEEIRQCTEVMSLLNDQPVRESAPLAFTLDPADVVLFLP
jgi:hypothetical protein